MTTEQSGGGATDPAAGERPAGGPAVPFKVDPKVPGERAASVLRHLRLIEGSVIAHIEEGRYSVLPIAIEGWLKTAIAGAEQLAAELRGEPETPEGDAPDPGGEHGGPAD